VKAGKYMLLALKDENSDNKFQQKTDKIAFHKSFIDVPTDSLYTLTLFKEVTDFKAIRPKLVSGEKIAFGYEGDYNNIQITLKSEIPEDFTSRITKDALTDTLYYWYQPKLELDSLVFNVSKQDFNEDFVVRLKDNKKDTLVINANPTGNIEYDQAFKIFGTTPFKSFDTSKITVIDKDSTKVTFISTFDTITNSLDLNFEKTENNSYKINVLPETFIDFFGNTNDSLSFNAGTQPKDKFGNLRIRLNNATYPLIVQLTTENDEVKYEKYSSKQEVLDFLNISPGKYLVRVILDKNGNRKYDTGNYLKKIDPEKVVYFTFDQNEEVRADWSIETTLNFTTK
jgi:uncharacterized protein (DUF2141 family)